jgi:Xaa-Pro aminopeptidase
MTLTANEKKQRHHAIQQVVKEKNLRAILLIGDTNVGHGFYGDFRYYANHRVNFQRQIAIVFPDSEPVLFLYSQFGLGPARQRSFINDCRVGSNYIASVVELLRERNVSSGRFGINSEMLPMIWYDYLRKEMPGIELVEVHDEIMGIRLRRSKEEAGMYRKGAALADAGFEAALKVIHPGASEYEIIAEIEYVARKEGAEEHFTLIGSGKFSFGDANRLPLPYNPSHRRIEAGDTVVLEITPRYEGYWTQLVRMVNVWQPNHDLAKMQTVARDALKAGLEQFRPGKKVKDVTAKMQSYIATCGFVGKPPFGHICGVDLVEERVALDNERVIEPGFVAIIHPMVHTADGKNVIFWGETYLATAEGYERLHQATDEILTV